jgi:hypothetical protein
MQPGTMGSERPLYAQADDWLAETILPFRIAAAARSIWLYVADQDAFGTCLARRDWEAIVRPGSVFGATVAAAVAIAQLNGKADANGPDLLEPGVAVVFFTGIVPFAAVQHLMLSRNLLSATVAHRPTSVSVLGAYSYLVSLLVLPTIAVEAGRFLSLRMLGFDPQLPGFQLFSLLWLLLLLWSHFRVLHGIYGGIRYRTIAKAAVIATVAALISWVIARNMLGAIFPTLF